MRIARELPIIALSATTESSQATAAVNVDSHNLAEVQTAQHNDLIDLSDADDHLVTQQSPPIVETSARTTPPPQQPSEFLEANTAESLRAVLPTTITNGMLTTTRLAEPTIPTEIHLAETDSSNTQDSNYGLVAVQVEDEMLQDIINGLDSGVIETLQTPNYVTETSGIVPDVDIAEADKAITYDEAIVQLEKTKQLGHADVEADTVGSETATVPILAGPNAAKSDIEEESEVLLDLAVEERPPEGDELVKDGPISISHEAGIAVGTLLEEAPVVTNDINSTHLLKKDGRDDGVGIEVDVGPSESAIEGDQLDAFHRTLTLAPAADPTAENDTLDKEI